MQLGMASARLILVFLVMGYLLSCAPTPSPSQTCSAHPIGLYLRVHQSAAARMFYAYYEAISPPYCNLSGTPILLWLQGGPGCSGMTGNFYELGPWKIGEDGKLHKNPTPWNRLFGLLFLDNPVGTGFSIATSAQDIPADEEAVGRDVYAALQHFFRRNPTFRARPFYVTGQSYAGKYVPSLALRIITHPNPPRIRLDGLAIGNGLTHPVVQVQSHASVAHSMGLIDSPQRLRLEELQQRAVELVQQAKWRDAANAREQALQWLHNVTGLPTLFDIRRTSPYQIDCLSRFLIYQERKGIGHIRRGKAFSEMGKFIYINYT